MGGVAEERAPLVRNATEADLPAVGALLAEGFAGKFVRIFGADTGRVPALLARFTGLRLRRELVVVFVAELDGRTVGVLEIAHGRESMRDRWEQFKIALHEVGLFTTLRSIIGVILLMEYNEEEQNLAYISELAVTAAQRNQGIGAALLAHAETWAHAHGKRGLSLHVAAGNPAQHLYERAGFQLKERLEARLERRLFDVEAWLHMVKAFPEGSGEAAKKT